MSLTNANFLINIKKQSDIELADRKFSLVMSDSEQLEMKTRMIDSLRSLSSQLFNELETERQNVSTLQRALDDERLITKNLTDKLQSRWYHHYFACFQR